MSPNELTELSTNWKKLQAQLSAERHREPPKNGVKRKRAQEDLSSSKRKRAQDDLSRSKRLRSGIHSSPGQNNKSRTMDRVTGRPRAKSESRAKLATDAGAESRPSTAHDMRRPAALAQVNEGVSESNIPGRYIALDCEMVGFGPTPEKDSQLARVSLVNYHGDQVYDSHVLPQLPVTDYRTAISGIRPHHLKAGYARPFKEVQKDVSAFLKGRILVGHAVSNDLKVLILNHPPRDIRDTARHQPFRDRAKGKTPSLRKLAKELLGLDIQTGEHSSVEDARIAMLLYKTEKQSFDEHIRGSMQATVLPVAMVDANGEQVVAAKARKKKKKRKRN